tara:strand:- start:1362 stop:1832 length:471 start_codon:yes stop_codon:yes gene_type:complete
LDNPFTKKITDFHFLFRQPLELCSGWSMKFHTLFSHSLSVLCYVKMPYIPAQVGELPLAGLRNRSRKIATAASISLGQTPSFLKNYMLCLLGTRKNIEMSPQSYLVLGCIFFLAVHVQESCASSELQHFNRYFAKYANILPTPVIGSKDRCGSLLV